MNFIKKIFNGKSGEQDEAIHLQFQKFSKGEFKSKAVIFAKFVAGKWKINTTPEFANELVRDVAKKLPENEKIEVTGAIVYTGDLPEKIPYKDKKQFQGVKRYILDTELTKKEILEILNELPKAFFGLSFKTPDEKTQLKIKPKAPKSGKPGKGKDKPKADFCKLITQDKDFAEDFIFENPEFKEASLEHTFIIDKLEIPEEIKKSGNFKIMRESAIRVGKIIRSGEIDGKKINSEKDMKV
ncbi:MAG: hypothetical protein ACOCUU_01210 [Nanoarchaeota archaeon]